MVPARVLRTALTIAAALSILAPELAAAQSDETPPEAVEFYRQARERYEAGQYREASLALERALVLDPDSPTLVYNLARVYELLGELDQALAMYERYQRLLPQQQAQEQERADASIRRLNGALESGNDQVEEPPRQVEALRQLPGLVLVRENGVADLGFWLTLSMGGLSLATGVVLGIVANDARQSANTFFDAQGFGIAADITLGVGGAAVVAALLLYFLREHTVERAPIRDGEADEGDVSVAPSAWATPDGLGGGLGLTGRL